MCPKRGRLEDFLIIFNLSDCCMTSAVGANTSSQLFGGCSGRGFGGLCWTDSHSQKLPLQLAMIRAFVQEQRGHLQSHSILS